MQSAEVCKVVDASGHWCCKSGAVCLLSPWIVGSAHPTNWFSGRDDRTGNDLVIDTV